MGTVIEQRIADSGVVVSYEIDTDLGYRTTRHRRFMKPLSKEHDPKEKLVTEINNKTNLEDLNDTAAESGRDILEEVEQGAPRRSGHIKRDRVITGVTRIKVNKVSTTLEVDNNSLSMGGSCSSEPTEEKKKNKNLEAPIKLYEAGITDLSMHGMHSS